MKQSSRTGSHRQSKPLLLQLPAAGALPKAQRPARQTRRESALVFIGGLLVLQAIILGFALNLAFSKDPQPDSVDTEAAFHVPAPAAPQAVLPEPPPPVVEISTPAPKVNTVLKLPAPPPEVVAPTPLPQPAVLHIRGMEITQGIQVFNEPEHPRCYSQVDHPDYVFCNNSMPLVAARHTMVRAYLACNGPCPTAETAVRLRVFKDGYELAGLVQRLLPQTASQTSNLSMPDLRGNLENSVNFALIPPPDWLSGQITFYLEALPPAGSHTQPATLSLTRQFVERKPLRIAYLPVKYQGLQPADPQNADYWLQRMYPVPAVEYYRLPVPDLTLDGDLSKGEVLRKLLYSYWFFAQSHTPENRPDQLFGWLPMEYYNGGASDPFWCPNCAGPHSSRVAFGGLRPEQDIGGPRILVHEIAHNLGAQHAWSPTYNEDNACFKGEGVDIRVDPEWPYVQTPHIQEFGIDLYSNPPVIYPPSHYDMMAYCAQPWISPHTYRKIFNSPFLQPGVPAEPILANFAPQAETADSGTLLVSGIIYPNGSVAQPEVITLEGDAFGAAASFSPPLEFIPPPGDDYCLNVEANDGTSLAQHCFDAGFVDLESGLPTEPASFFFTLPKINSDAVGKVSISKNQVEMVSVTPSNSPPQVDVTFPTGGEQLSGQQTITWDANDADGDRLLFDLFYSPDGGMRWLPLALRLTESSYTFFTGQVEAADRMRIKVVANDGFHTTSAESGTPFTLQTLPKNSVSIVGPATVQPGQPFEVTVVAHQVAEPGLFGAQFNLGFDPNLVQVEAVQANPDFELVVAADANNDTGQVNFAASRQGRVENLSGQVPLATLTLSAAHNPGPLALKLHNVVAGARGGLPLPVAKIQGAVITIVE